MDIPDNFVITFFPKSIADDGLERRLLVAGSQRNRAAEYICNQLRLDVFRFLGVIQDAMDVA